MAQFALYKNKNTKTRNSYPYLLDVQANLLDGLQTRVVAPLAKSAVLQKKAMQHVTPLITFDGEKYLLLIPQLSGIAKADLGPRVGDLSRYRDEIIAALNFLFLGI
ncbi:MAG TPA: CcdB family protein [Spongiibacteraceae bacterium]|nr:CcdB family protein [Spongiibacteraceae bacterium]